MKLKKFIAGISAAIMMIASALQFPEGSFNIDFGFSVNAEDNILDSTVYSSSASLTLPTLSPDSAAMFIGFVYNLNPKSKELTKELNGEITNSDVYKIITNTYSGNDLSEKAYVWLEFIIAQTSVMSDQSTNNKEWLINDIANRLEKYVPEDGKLDEKVLDDLYNKVLAKKTEYFKELTDKYFRYFTGKKEYESLFTLSDAYSAYGSVKGSINKAKKYVDYIMSAIEGTITVFECERSGRYSYFNAYLSNRQNYSSANDEIFRTIMDYNRLAATDNSWLSGFLNLFTWISNKDSFNNHFDLIESWAEYTYQLEMYLNNQVTDNDFDEEPTENTNPTDPPVQDLVVGSKFTINGIQYKLTDSLNKYVSIIYCLSNDSVINLNENINYNNIRYKITAIDDKAFYDCKTIKTVIIPDSIKIIGESAFYNCINLKNVDITSATIISNMAFEHCTSLKNVKLGNKLKKIGDSAFRYCGSLKEISIPDSVEEIGRNVLDKCFALEKLTLPYASTKKEYVQNDSEKTYDIYSQVSDMIDGMGNGEGSVFYKNYMKNDYSLKEIVITGGEIIPDYAFYGIPTLQKITLPDGVVSIGSYAFSECMELSNINIPDSVKSIGDGAFFNCDILKSIIIKNPECNIYDYINTLPVNIIYGYNNSTAQSYAQKYNISFICIENASKILCSTGKEIIVNYNNRQIVSDSLNIGMLEINENYIESKVSDLKWVLETTAGKTSSAAKFKNKNGKYNLSTISDVDNVEIGALKSNGMFNNIVVLKAVSKDYNYAKKKGTVYAECTFYVNPSEVTKFKPVKDAKNAAGFISKNDKTGISLTQVIDNTCTLTLPEGASYKLPFAAADGADKTLSYVSDSTNFNVLNGTVKGISAGNGTIKVKPVNGDCEYTVNVIVTGKISKLRMNTSLITLFPNMEQEFTVSPTTSSNTSEILKVDFIKDPSAYIVKTSTDNGLTWNELSSDGVTATGPVMFSISLKPESTVTASEKIVITSDKTAAKVSIPIKYAVVPQNVKNFIEKIKVTKGSTYRVINIPVNSYSILNCSVSPANADNRFTFAEVDESGNTVTASDKIFINGDVIRALKTGTVYVQATAKGINEKGEDVKSGIYQINIYEPADTIIWKDTAYSVKGGHLMPTDIANTTTDKNIQGGQTITVDEPVFANAGTENIDWTVNNTTGITLTKDNGKLNMELLQPGTYTITGKTAYTNHKYTFKVMVAKTMTDENVSDRFKIQKYNAENISWSDVSDLTIKKGNTEQLRVSGDGVCGTIKWSSTNTKVATVSAKGIVKAVGNSGTAEIKATITTYKADGKTKVTTEKKFNVTASAADIIVAMKKIPVFVQKDKPFTVTATVKNAPTGAEVEWKCRNSNGDVSALNVVNGKNASIAAAGTYYIYPVINDIEGVGYTISVYDVVPATIKALDPSETQTLKLLADKTAGVHAGDVISIPIAAYVTNTATKEITTADYDEIAWTSSNINVVNITNCVKSEKAGEYAIATIKVSENTKYVGKVTLTGVLKNSGKKVTISLYVN